MATFGARSKRPFNSCSVSGGNRRRNREEGFPRFRPEASAHENRSLEGVSDWYSGTWRAKLLLSHSARREPRPYFTPHFSGGWLGRLPPWLATPSSRATVVSSPDAVPRGGFGDHPAVPIPNGIRGSSTGAFPDSARR